MTKQQAYQRWLEADDAWQAALTAAFGGAAQEVRYTTAGRAGSFAPLYQAVQDARREYVDTPMIFEAL